MRLVLNKKTVLIAVIILAVLLNLMVLYTAYPRTFALEGPNLARDFSAYYMGEWRLIHNPSKVYYNGAVPGDYPIVGQSQPFKYAPSFLILLMPVLTLSYQNALDAFDITQFLLILFLAFFVYKLVKDKNIFLGVSVAIIVVLNPILFAPSLNYDFMAYLTLRMLYLRGESFSVIYYSAYLLANAHILQTVLLLGAFYFGFAKKTWASALLFAFSAFDPRSALLALPLLLWYNRHSLWKFIGESAFFLAATNLPFFFYYNIGFSFLITETKASVISEMYLYDWLPIYSIIALSVLEIFTFLSNRKNQTANWKKFQLLSRLKFKRFKGSDNFMGDKSSC